MITALTIAYVIVGAIFSMGMLKLYNSGSAEEWNDVPRSAMLFSITMCSFFWPWLLMFFFYSKVKLLLMVVLEKLKKGN